MIAFASTLPAQQTEYKFQDQFSMSTELKRKIQNKLETYLMVANAGEMAQKELQHFFGNAQFTFEKLGEKYRFKYAGKLSVEQRAVDRCEGELTNSAESEISDWAVEIDFCNFDL